MAYTNVTGTAAAVIMTGKVQKAIIQVNTATTGNIAVYDNTSATLPLVGTITNPTVGSQYEYWTLTTGLSVKSSVACDITVSAV